MTRCLWHVREVWPWVARGVSVGRPRAARVCSSEPLAWVHHKIPMKCTKQHQHQNYVGHSNGYPRTPHGQLTGCTRTIHGRSTSDPRALHGHSTGVLHAGYGQLRTTRERPMGNPCATHGASMDRLWGLRVVSVGRSWVARGECAGCLWSVDGVCRGRPWKVRGFSIRCRFGVHGLLLGAHGVPWDICSVFVGCPLGVGGVSVGSPRGPRRSRGVSPLEPHAWVDHDPGSPTHGLPMLCTWVVRGVSVGS